MQKEKVVKACKSTIGTILIAIFIVIGVFLAVKICWGTEIENIFMLANKVSININKDKEQQPITIDEEKTSGITDSKFGGVPYWDMQKEYGTQYATIEIPRIGANLPVYFGDTLEILKKGVGHSSGSYFPGEGGSILYMGHNSKKVFRRFSELQIGDEIKVTTTYGEYNYKIYDMQLIKETDLDKVPIQRDEEILMVYTCYPFNNVGYATQRYVVYAKLEK